MIRGQLVMEWDDYNNLHMGAAEPGDVLDRLVEQGKLVVVENRKGSLVVVLPAPPEETEPEMPHLHTESSPQG